MKVTLVDGLMEINVSAMVTPNLFWIQVVDGSNILNTLESKMTKYYNVKENRELHTLKEVSREKF